MLSSGNGIANLVPGLSAGVAAQTSAAGTLTASNAALTGLAAGTSGGMAGEGGAAAAAADATPVLAGADPSAAMDAAAAQIAEGLAAIVDGREKTARAAEEMMANARGMVGKMADLEQEASRLGAELESLRAAHASCGLLAERAAGLEEQQDELRRAMREAGERQAATAAVLQSAIVRSACADAIIKGALAAIQPFVREGSPLVEGLRRASDLLSGAMGMMASRDFQVPVTPSAGALSDEEKVPAWLGEKGGMAFFEINRQLVPSLFRSLDVIYPGEKGLRKVFVVAALRLLNSGVRGARELVELAFSSLLNPQEAEFAKRGLVHQVIRTVNILDSGRNVDEVNRIQFRYVEFRGWWIDSGAYSIVRRDMKSNVDADLRDGGTIMEIKGMRISRAAASLLKEMLRESSGRSGIVKYDFNRKQNGSDPVQLAVHIANQLVRYRLLIHNGKIRKLEWHITSSEPVPDDVVEAIYDFFPENGIEIVWYRDALTARGEILLPPSRAVHDSPAADAAMPAVEADAERFEETYSNVAASVETAAVIEAAGEGTLPKRGAVDASSGGASSAQTADDGSSGRSEDAGEEAAGESGTLDESAGLDAPRGATPLQVSQTSDEIRALLSAVVYADGRCLLAARHDYAIIEGFLDSMVEDGRQGETGETLGLGETAPDRIFELFNQWFERRDSATAPQAPPDPWDNVREDKAQKRFNNELVRVAGKNQIRWDLRITQGIQNADIIKVLGALSGASPAKNNQRLRDRLGEFIIYLRTSYLPGSYFKTHVDGPRLVDIIKHLIWLENGSGE